MLIIKYVQDGTKKKTTKYTRKKQSKMSEIHKNTINSHYQTWTCPVSPRLLTIDHQLLRHGWASLWQNNATFNAATWGFSIKVYNTDNRRKTCNFNCQVGDESMPKCDLRLQPHEEDTVNLHTCPKKHTDWENINRTSSKMLWLGESVIVSWNTVIQPYLLKEKIRSLTISPIKSQMKN